MNKMYFLFCVAGIFCITTLLQAMPDDSVVTIHSYAAPEELTLKTRFATTRNGDTAVMLYAHKINRVPTSETDTILLRIRMWNTKTSATLATQSFHSVQSGFSSSLYNLLPINNIPRLFYSPDPNSLDIYDFFNNKRLQHFSFPSTIRSLTWSPGNLHTFIATDDRKYYIVDNVSGEIILRDSTYNITTGGVHSYSVATCAQIDWTLDNSLAMIVTNEFTDSIRYKSLWHPFDIKTRRYLPKTFPKLNGPGNWLPNGRRFIYISLGRVTSTDLDSTRILIPTGKQFIGSECIDKTPYFMVIDLGNTISKWHIDSAKKVFDFNLENIEGYTFSPNAQTLAYMDNGVITLLNTETNQGIHRIPLDFPYKVTYSDKRSLQLVNGNNAIIIRDTSNQYRFLNFNTEKVMVTLDSNDEWQASPDGTVLFTIGRQIDKYDLFTGQKLSTFPINDILEGVLDIAFHPSGNELASIDSTALRVWNTKTGLPLREHQYGSLRKLSWSPDSSLIYLMRSDAKNTNYITAVKATTLDTAFHVKPQFGFLQFDGFSPDSKYFLVREKEILSVYNSRSGQLEHRISNTAALTSAAWTADSRYLSMGDSAGYAKVMLWSKDSVVFSHKASMPVQYLYVDASLKYAICRSDSIIVLLKTVDGSEVQYFTRPTSKVLFISDTLFVAIYDELMVEASLTKGAPLQFQTVTPAFFNMQRDYYATTGLYMDDTTRVFSYDTHSLLSALPGIKTQGNIIWSNDGAKLAYTDMLNNIVIWSPTGMTHKPPKPTSVEWQDESQELSAYPNPASQSVQLSALNRDAVQSISLVDNLGNTVLSLPSAPVSQQQLDVSSLSQGWYVAEVVLTNGERLHRHIMVVR